ncbi:MAG: TIGR03087 family PEP-CTERM/XrtA system glycosyltransferase [Rubrivivax sp.]|nr:TIGR03087 family PEP-CTERM/XrtA system glycosyltransferase [Rubrivivax sp.]
MATVLMLAHRLPYPPNKGDKIHTYQLLKSLASRHKVLLGTFVDDPDDEQYVPKVREMCAELHVSRLDRRSAKLRALGGLADGRPLSVAFYRDAALAGWVQRQREARRADVLFVYSSSMLQYAEDFDLPMAIDFADVDSAKWAEYARRHGFPMSWVYRREAAKLLGVERRFAARARWSLFATEKEAQLFRELAPESADRSGVLGNGVDAEFFTPDPARPSPFPEGEIPVVFMGAMDYWPNVDAVTWFAAEALPQLRQRWPTLRFHIVGRSPAPAVQALQSDAVNVTGTVPDVRAYVQHAAVVVAPLRLARGIQNKVLEAMAMARPVVAATSCVASMDVTAGEHALAAETAADYAREVAALIENRERAAAIGRAGRQRVIDVYGWDARLSRMDEFLGIASAAPALEAQGA